MVHQGQSEVCIPDVVGTLEQYPVPAAIRVHWTVLSVTVPPLAVGQEGVEEPDRPPEEENIRFPPPATSMLGGYWVSAAQFGAVPPELYPVALVPPYTSPI